MSELEKITELCVRLGSAPAQASIMARQLMKRADQISTERSISREAAMAHLLQVLVQGSQGIAPTGINPPVSPSK